MNITQNEKSHQGLFSMPSCSEMAVWCELNEEIDPGKWAMLCRKIGKMNIGEFERISGMIMTQVNNISEVRENIPLVSIGYSGIGGEYQREIG
ncbi:MAG: hypothetical protein ACYC54_07650 [Sedimentisphaerales bacterium]